MLKVGPFTLTARCRIDETIGGFANYDQADILIATTQAKSAFDGDDLLGSLDPGDNIETRQFVNTEERPTGDAPLRGVLGRPRDRRRRQGLHQGLVPVRRRERQRRRGQVQVRRLHLPVGVIAGARGSAARTEGRCASAAPLCVADARNSGDMRRNHRPCATGGFTTSCSSSPSRPRTCCRAAVEAGRRDPVRGGREPRRALGALSLPAALGRVRPRALHRAEVDARLRRRSRRAGARRGRVRLPAGDGRELRAGRRARSRRGRDRALPGRACGRTRAPSSSTCRASSAPIASSSRSSTRTPRSTPCSRRWSVSRSRASAGSSAPA